MRRILFAISLFFLGQMVYCQTYTLILEYEIPRNTGHSYDFDFTSSNQGGLYSDSGNGKLSNNYKLIEFNDLKYNANFQLQGRSICGPDRDGDIYEDISRVTFLELLTEEKDLEVSLECFYASVTKFKPNVTISNLEVNSPSEICAGSLLQLGAFPAGFDSSVYHWQYSIDNQVNWIDVPLIINGKTTNNVALTEMTLQELLGTTHLAYLNKTIFFRLGYNQNTSFTNPLAITYSPCAPILVDRTYTAPDCNGGQIKEITAYFERPLKLNETLNPMQIIPFPKTNGDAIFFNQKEPITGLDFDNEKGLWVYKFKYLDSNKLENNKEYIIEYQANMNGMPTGTLQSSQKFKYNDPTAVQFEIIKAENPSCHDGTVEIVISVTGGTGAYKFYLNNIEKFPIKEADGFYHLKNLSPKEYSIKVTDTNNCIDANKYD